MSTVAFWNSMPGEKKKEGLWGKIMVPCRYFTNSERLAQGDEWDEHADGFSCWANAFDIHSRVATVPDGICVQFWENSIKRFFGLIVLFSARHERMDRFDIQPHLHLHPSTNFKGIWQFHHLRRRRLVGKECKVTCLINLDICMILAEVGCFYSQDGI
jgi:hypothetical protein